MGYLASAIRLISLTLTFNFSSSHKTPVSPVHTPAALSCCLSTLSFPLHSPTCTPHSHFFKTRVKSHHSSSPYYSESHSFWPQSNNKVVGLIVRSGPCVFSCFRDLWMCQGLRQNLRITAKRHAAILGEVEGDWYWCPLFWHLVFEENFLEMEFCFLSLRSESYFSWSAHHPPSTGGLSGGVRVCGTVLHVTRPGGEPHCDDLSLSPCMVIFDNYRSISVVHLPLPGQFIQGILLEKTAVYIPM